MSAPDDPAMQTTLRLIQAARVDDRGALEDLFARYAPRVRRIVALRLGRPIHGFAEFDDLVQETLLKAFRSFGDLRLTTVGAFRNFLSRCAENAIRDALRRRDALKRGGGEVRRFADLGDESLSSSIFAGAGPSPSELAMGRELEERIEKALLEMDERYREVIILRQLCGLSDREIAGELGFENVDYVKTVCHRALRKLDQVLNPRR